MVSKCSRLSITLFLIILWLILQSKYLNNYICHKYNANPHQFSQYFELIPIYRSNLHQKGLEYWYRWLQLKHEYFSTSLTLLHFDIHGYDDIISDEIGYECSPQHFFQYDQFVIKILQLTEDLIDNFIVDLNEEINITKKMLEIGYYSKIVWIYPDHWSNFSETITFDVHYKLYQQFAQHQTYFITPFGRLQHKYSFLKLDKYPSDMHNFWQDVLFKNSIEMTVNELDPAKSLRIDIMAIPLSQLSTHSFLNNDESHQIILDIDLDFFSCQNIAENIMEKFEWNKDLINKFNVILSHHQYLPQKHIPPHLHQKALITLINSYVNNWNIPNITSDINHDINHSKKSISIPSITDVLQMISETNDFVDDALYYHDIIDLQQLLQCLYRLQLELGSDFIEPIDLFLSTHSYLDDILQAIEENNNLNWYHNLPDILDININHSYLSSSIINNDGSIQSKYYQTSPYLTKIKKKFKKIYDPNVNETKFSADNIIDVAISLHQILDSTHDQHKVSIENIETYLNESQQSLDNVNIEHLTNFIISKPVKIWNPDHDWLHAKIQSLQEEQSIDNNHMSYSEILKMLNVNLSYLYNGWENIVDKFRNESWTQNYIQQTKDELVDIKKESINLTTHDIDTIINWNNLDKVQQHFLQNGDHRAMKKFINNLNKKQKIFLKWLLFCFYYPQNCDDGHHPFELVDNHQISNIIFGERFAWNEINRMLSFVESTTKQNYGLLQLEFTLFLTSTQWIKTKQYEQNHIPTKNEIKQSVDKIIEFLSSPQNTLITGDIELSRGHVPMKYQIWIECLFMKRLNNIKYDDNHKLFFMRYQNIESDQKSVLHKIPNCLKHIYI